MIALALFLGVALGVLGSRGWRWHRDRSDAAYMARPVMPDETFIYLRLMVRSRDESFINDRTKAEAIVEYIYRSGLRPSLDQIQSLCSTVSYYSVEFYLRSAFRSDLLMLEHATKAQEAIDAEETRMLLGETRLKAVGNE